jgi:PAS domain S-box-containing protein
MEQWPDEMRGVVSAALHSAFPICTGWGDEYLQIYNDAYNAIFGAKHPDSFGAPVRDSWSEIWEFVNLALEQVRTTRQPLWFTGMLLPLARAGMPEECYFDFSYSPVLSKDGKVLGVMSAAVERTAEVVARRRKPVDSWAFEFTGQQDTLGMLAHALAERLDANDIDAWYAAILPVDSAGRLRACPVWQLRPRDSLARAFQYPAQPPQQVLRLDIAPSGEHADYAHLVPVRDSLGRPIGAISFVPSALVTPASHREFCQTVLDRLHAALREAEARRSEILLLQKDFEEQGRLYAFLFENMEDAAVYTATGPNPGDAEMILAANPKACELTGYSLDELRGKQREDLFFPGDTALQAAVLARSTSKVFMGELRLRRKDGSAVPVEISARLVEIAGGTYRSVCIVRDVTWRRARERALADRARFEAMVELTGGIAHDFNNFLAVILGNLDALEGATAEGAPERQLIANAILGAERAAGVTGQLLTYAKRSNLQTAPLQWKPFLDEVEGLLSSTVGETSIVKIDVEPDLPVCDLDAAQLTSTLLNLAANARDAMPGGGTLTVRARRMHWQDASTGEDSYDLPAGEYVELCVTDTGVGINPDAIRRIFEPFFTTKDSDSGTGLGLAMVQGFVRQSGGDVRVSSREGQGTQFQLLLPAAGSAEAIPLSRAKLSGAGEIVLLVEDNKAVREQTMAMLRNSGLHVLESHDGQSALQQLRGASRVDILLANVTLPGAMSGVELAVTAREDFPGLPVVLTTGGGRGPLFDRVQTAGFRVMRKPFAARALVQCVLAEVRSHARPGAGF